jgi:transcription initiation factor TFIIB
MVIEQTAYMYRKMLAKKMTRGRSIFALVLASLYLSCLTNSEKQTQKGISTASGISMVTIRNRASSLAKILNWYGLLIKNITA